MTREIFQCQMQSARVTENTYSMLKGRWRISYKKTEIEMYNLKYVVIACVVLHNLCLAKKDSCNLPWRLIDEEFELKHEIINKSKSKSASNKNAGIIKNCP